MHYRKSTLALIIFSTLMLLSIADSIANASATVDGPFLAFWLVGFNSLSMYWFMSRPPRRLCPQCAREVTVGLIACEGCGYSFLQQPHAAAATPPLPSPLPVLRRPPGVSAAPTGGRHAPAAVAAACAAPPARSSATRAGAPKPTRESKWRGAALLEHPAEEIYFLRTGAAATGSAATCC